MEPQPNPQPQPQSLIPRTQPQMDAQPQSQPNPNPELQLQPQVDQAASDPQTPNKSPLKVTKKKRCFTKDETETVRMYFEDYIQSRNTHNLEECKNFCINHPMDLPPISVLHM